MPQAKEDECYQSRHNRFLPKAAAAVTGYDVLKKQLFEDSLMPVAPSSATISKDKCSYARVRALAINVSAPREMRAQETCGHAAQWRAGKPSALAERWVSSHCCLHHEWEARMPFSDPSGACAKVHCGCS